MTTTDATLSKALTFALEVIAAAAGTAYVSVSTAADPVDGYRVSGRAAHALADLGLVRKVAQTPAARHAGAAAQYALTEDGARHRAAARTTPGSFPRPVRARPKARR